MSEYDVTIIGAGLSGLAVSRDLAQRGWRVALIDRKPNLTVGVHTIGIFVRRTLEGFDLPEDCLGPVVRHVSLYSPGGQQLDLESRYEEFRVGKMARLYTRWLEDCRAAGVDIHLETGFQRVRQDQTGNQQIVELQTGTQSRELTTRFLIGADGASSRVAEQLGLSRNREWIVGVEQVYQHVPMLGVPRFHVWLDPVLAPGYIAWLVHDGEEVHVGVGGYAARFEPRAALNVFLEQMRAKFPLDAGELIEQRGGRIPVGGVLPNLINSRGLLLGDAAGAVSPLTAGGLDPCLRQSQAAAIVTDAWLKTGQESILNAYDGGWMRGKFKLRNWLRQCLSAVRYRWQVECGFLLLKTWPGTRFAHRVFFSPGSFPDLPLHQNAALAELLAGRM